MDKKKKMIIIVAVLLVIAIAIGAYLIGSGKGNENKYSNPIQTLDISQVFELENIENSKYEIEENKNLTIASKYISATNMSELKARVEFLETVGKMIYVRDDYKDLNIYQTEYKLDKYENITAQVEGIIENFESTSKSYLGLDLEEKAKSEELYGESTINAKRPIGESIYYENRLYSKTYEKDKKIYDMNFYRNNEKIVCELVFEIK